jgi:PiT family inorganic phosphate transporter
VWNLFTWYIALPSSSSHALIGSLVGAAMVYTGSVSVVNWTNILDKVIIPLFSSPLIGIVIGFGVMKLLFFILRNAKQQAVNRWFSKLQIFSAALMAYSHGSNDAQKTMGIIALTLFAATQAGQLDHLPSWLSFLRTPGPPPGKAMEIAVWIKVVCALTMATGTAVGGWRIIRTLGHKMVKLHPINGFAAETSSATVILAATQLGIPVSTTHNISAAIMGVGAARRLNAIKWTVVERMVWAWILTIPVTGFLAYGLVRLLQNLGVA